MNNYKSIILKKENCLKILIASGSAKKYLRICMIHLTSFSNSRSVLMTTASDFYVLISKYTFAHHVTFCKQGVALEPTVQLCGNPFLPSCVFTCTCFSATGDGEFYRPWIVLNLDRDRLLKPTGSLASIIDALFTCYGETPAAHWPPREKKTRDLTVRFYRSGKLGLNNVSFIAYICSPDILNAQLMVMSLYCELYFHHKCTAIDEKVSDVDGILIRVCIIHFIFITVRMCHFLYRPYYMIVHSVLYV